MNLKKHRAIGAALGFGGAPELVLELHGTRLRFACHADFAFALDAWTHVPLQRVLDMLRDPPTALAEADAIARARDTIKLQMFRHHAAPSALLVHCDALRAEAVSKDYGWRHLFAEFAKLAVRDEDYVRLALLRYVDYLTAREQFARMLAAVTETHATSHAATLVTGSLNTTMEGPASPPASASARRLPPGRPTSIGIVDGQRSIRLLLANFPVEFAYTDRWVIRAHGGHTYEAYPRGRFIIGRGSGCDVVVAPTYGHVSRRHLAVDVVSPHEVVLTDLSRAGTFVEQGQWTPEGERTVPRSRGLGVERDQRLTTTTLDQTPDLVHDD